MERLTLQKFNNKRSSEFIKIIRTFISAKRVHDRTHQLIIDYKARINAGLAAKFILMKWKRTLRRMRPNFHLRLTTTIRHSCTYFGMVSEDTMVEPASKILHKFLIRMNRNFKLKSKINKMFKTISHFQNTERWRKRMNSCRQF